MLFVNLSLYLAGVIFDIFYIASSLNIFVTIIL